MTRACTAQLAPPGIIWVLSKIDLESRRISHLLNLGPCRCHRPSGCCMRTPWPGDVLSIWRIRCNQGSCVCCPNVGPNPEHLNVHAVCWILLHFFVCKPKRSSDFGTWLVVRSRECVNNTLTYPVLTQLCRPPQKNSLDYQSPLALFKAWLYK